MIGGKSIRGTGALSWHFTLFHKSSDDLATAIELRVQVDQETRGKIPWLRLIALGGGGENRPQGRE